MFAYVIIDSGIELHIIMFYYCHESQQLREYILYHQSFLNSLF